MFTCGRNTGEKKRAKFNIINNMHPITYESIINHSKYC